MTLNAKLTNGSKCQIVSENDGFEHQTDECGSKRLKTMNSGSERQTKEWEWQLWTSSSEWRLWTSKTVNDGFERQTVNDDGFEGLKCGERVALNAKLKIWWWL